MKLWQWRGNLLDGDWATGSPCSHRRRRFCGAFWAGIVLATMASGCAAPAQHTPAWPPLERVALFHVEEVKDFTFERRTPAGLILSPLGIGAIALAGALEDQDRVAKAAAFASRLRAQAPEFGARLHSSVRAALIESRYEVIDVPSSDRGTPGAGVNLADLHKAVDAFMSLRINRIGVASYMSGGDYRPQVNITVRVVSVRDRSDLFHYTISYGADARAQAIDMIQADPRYSYSSFDALMTSFEELMTGFSDGLRLFGPHVVREMRKQGL